MQGMILTGGEMVKYSFPGVMIKVKLLILIGRVQKKWS